VVEVLSPEEILAIHERVCADFATTDDPVGMSGPRDGGQHLYSVAARQHVGFGDRLKYPDPISNAASLMFGICCGHPFHNGNKRTALISMLAHLDKNNLALAGVTQKALYDMVKAVAQHQLGVRPDPRKKNQDYTPREVDAEVVTIGKWLERYARPLKRGERQLTYRQLEKLLGKHDLYMRNPNKNSIGIYKRVQVKRGLLRNKTVEEMKHITTIPYPGAGRTVGPKIIKRVRRECHLDEAHGCDTASFYEGADMIDVFVIEYRGILARLAKE
jgi:death-on-curing protein